MEESDRKDNEIVGASRAYHLEEVGQLRVFVSELVPDPSHDRDRRRLVRVLSASDLHVVVEDFRTMVGVSEMKLVHAEREEVGQTRCGTVRRRGR